MNNYLKALPALFAAAALMTGCGGDSSQDGGGQAAFRAGLEGRLTFAGGLAGADVFIDLNDDGEAGEFEPYARTDAQGFFSYNPVSKTDYCKDQRAAQYIHCLSLPSSLPGDELVIIYSGGYKILSGEANEKTYRIVIDRDGLEEAAIELDPAKTLVTALAEREDIWVVLADLLGALLAYVDETEVPPEPLMLSAFSFTTMADIGAEADAREKFQQLVDAGVFAGLNSGGPTPSRDELIARILNFDIMPPMQLPTDPRPFFDWATFIVTPPITGFDFVPLDFISTLTIQSLPVIYQPIQAFNFDVHTVSSWALNYVGELHDQGLISAPDYSSPELRAQLVSLSAQAYSTLGGAQAQSEASFLLSELAAEISRNETLNNSFTEEQFEDVINGLFDLVAAADDDEILDVDGLLALLGDEGRDLGNLTPANFVIPSDLFNAALGQLQGKLIRLGYSSNGVEGKAALRLTSTGQLQACLQYDGVDELESPLYVTGEWQLLNANSIKVDFFIGPVLYETRVLKLDRAQLALPALESLKFDLASASADWDLVLEDVSSGWNAVVAAKHCGTFLNGG